MLNRPIETEDNSPENLHQSAKEHLKAFVQRIERLEESKADILTDIKAVYDEAKGTGFDAKIIRKIVAIRKKAAHERAEEEALMATYLAAIEGALDTYAPAVNGAVRKVDEGQTDIEDYTNVA